MVNKQPSLLLSDDTYTSGDQGTTSTFCYLGSFLVTFFMTANCLVITAICLYQYLMVTGPLEDTVQGFFFLSIAWTLAACMAVGPIFHWGKYELSSSIFGCSFQSVGKMEYISYNSTLMFVGYGFPLLLFMFCYSSILLAIRDSDTRIAKGWIVASVATDDSCIETGQKRIIMVTLLTVTVFICFRAPLFVSLLLNTLKVANKWLQIADQIAFWALYFHAALDPFVYAFQQGEYCKTLGEIATTLKRGFLECCCCCCCDNGVREGERRRGKRESSLPKIEEEQCE
eukprot:gene3182-3655_t